MRGEESPRQLWEWGWGGEMAVYADVDLLTGGGGGSGDSKDGVRMRFLFWGSKKPEGNCEHRKKCEI